MEQLNTLPARAVREKFIISNGELISEELNLRIMETDDGAILIYHGDRMLNIQRDVGRRFFIYEEQVIAIDVLIAIVTVDEDNFLLDYPMSELIVLMSPYGHSRDLLLGISELAHRRVDLYDSYQDEVIYGISRDDVLVKLDGCTKSMIWDMISKNNRGRIGYNGYFLRPHIPEHIEPFFVDDDAMKYSNAANSLGIYIIVNKDDQNSVYVANSLEEVSNIVSTSSKNLTVEEIRAYFKRKRIQDTLNGYYIRRIDDVYGVNVRYSSIVRDKEKRKEPTKSIFGRIFS